MNKKKILKYIIAATAVSGSLSLSQKIVQASPIEDANNYNTPDVASVGSRTVTRTGTVVNVTTNLRVRSGASTSNSTIGYLTNGTKVTITGESGDFYQINYNNGIGYVSKTYISVSSSDSSSSSTGNSSNNSGSTTTQTTKTGTVIKITSNLRVRSGASTSSSTIGYLTNGTKVTITGESGDFYQINYNNGTGYVSKTYISVDSTDNSTNTGNTNNSGSTSTETTKMGTVINVTTNLRVRSGASTSSSILGYLRNGSNVTIIGEPGDWYKIKFNDGTGYVAKEYIQVIDSINNSGSSSNNNNSNSNTSTDNTITAMSKTGQVVNISTNLRVRSAPNTDSSVLGYLLNGATVNITGQTTNWYRINYNGKEGYVCSDYIRIIESSGNTGTNQSSTYEKILSAMTAQIGSPYVWGGTGEFITKSLLDRLSAQYPSQAANGAYTRAYNYVGSGLRAFDCSGLMQWGFAQAGISIGRSTWDQINNGVEVSLNDLKPGDLLFYSSLQHVGMYIGNGQWIESPNKNADVRITTVPWGSIGRARRIL